MQRTKRFFGGLLTGLLLVVVLAVWIALPWYAVLALAVLVALWLLLTRSGALARAATAIGIAGLPQRLGASSVVVCGIAGVVGVLVAMLAMGQGFKATLDRTGGSDTAIILRGGSQAETNSVITRDQVPLIGGLDGIARDAAGHALVSAELSQVVNLPSMADGTDTNVQFRGVGPQAWALRPKLRLVEGRKFTPGLREIVVGRGAQRQFRGLEVGHQLKLANQA
ncbi:MAG: ABC transporter permease, partial [Lysobacteraceae bacterium]